MRLSYLVLAACLLFVGSIHALAREELETPEGKVIGITSQEELASGSCVGCEGGVPNGQCACNTDYAPQGPCCHMRAGGCPSSCPSYDCERDKTGKIIINKCY